jgi:CheY-like chemotaxis protein
MRVLQKLGYAVQIVNNGNEAVEEWARHRYDAIIMDLQMPEMDGFEATGRIRSQEGDPSLTRQLPSGQTRQLHTPIVAMTAHAMKSDRDRCLEAGMDAYVSKPITRAALVAALEECGVGRQSVVPR